MDTWRRALWHRRRWAWLARSLAAGDDGRDPREMLCDPPRPAGDDGEDDAIARWRWTALAHLAAPTHVQRPELPTPTRDVPLALRALRAAAEDADADGDVRDERALAMELAVAVATGEAALWPVLIAALHNALLRRPGARAWIEALGVLPALLARDRDDVELVARVRVLLGLPVDVDAVCAAISTDDAAWRCWLRVAHGPPRPRQVPLDGLPMPRQRVVYTPDLGVVAFPLDHPAGSLEALLLRAVEHGEHDATLWAHAAARLAHDRRLSLVCECNRLAAMAHVTAATIAAFQDAAAQGAAVWTPRQQAVAAELHRALIDRLLAAADVRDAARVHAVLQRAGDAVDPPSRLLLQARLALQTDDNDGAIIAAHELLALAPQSTEARLVLADALVRQQRFGLACEQLDRINEHEHEHERALVLRAQIALDADEPEQAIACIERLPDNAALDVLLPHVAAPLPPTLVDRWLRRRWPTATAAQLSASLLSLRTRTDLVRCGRCVSLADRVAQTDVERVDLCALDAWLNAVPCVQ